MPEVKILLGRDGSVKLEAFGFKGESCTDATAFIDKIFPSKKTWKEKPSFWEEEVDEKLVDGLPSGHCG